MRLPVDRPPRHDRRRGRRVSLPAACRAALVAAAALAAISLVAVPRAAAGTQTTFTLVGRGWGHGVGLCQCGAYGYAKHGWGYKAILKHYYTGIGFGHVSDRTIRVMLNQGQSAASVTAGSRFKANGDGRTVFIPGGTTATVTWSSGGYRVAAGGRAWTFGGPVTFSRGSSYLKLLTRNQNGWSGHYRGSLRVVHLTGGLTIVNKLRLEQYLYGVVPHESPASWPAAAVKTQTLAARSFASNRIGGAGAFDVYCTTSSQMYYGVDLDSARANSIIRQTRGEVPTYNGRAINAYFFSTSGGHTENVENVWGGDPVPYLKGVPDPYEVSPYHVWPENPIRKSPASLTSSLGTHSAAVPWGVKGTLQAIYVVRRGVSPRVVNALVIGSGGASEISGGRLRTELGLRDTWVSFTSLSITPSASTHKTITFGEPATVGGRRYPAIAADAHVTLHVHPDGGGWTTRGVDTRRDSQTFLGHDVKSSTYSASVHPQRTSEYYYSSKPGVSPHTTIRVRPAVTLHASTTSPAPGDTVVFTGTVKPRLTGTAVWLQRKDGATWKDLIRGEIKSDGTFTISWKAAEGTTILRARVPKTDHLVQGTSASVTVTATAAGTTPRPTATPSLLPTLTPTPFAPR
jgi:stage II sporulation protein D